MPFTSRSETSRRTRPSRFGRTALLGGAVSLALAGVVASEVGAFSSPALAQAPVVAAPVPNAPQTFADMVEAVRPAVVSIRVKAEIDEADDESGGMGGLMPNLPEGHPLERFFRQFGDRGPGGPEQGKKPGKHQFAMGQGSGFIISADGYVVTNNHVVDKASDVTVTLDDGTEFPAKVIGTDEKTDVALLKIDAKRSFPFVKFAEEDVRVGDWVVAVGNPFGLGGTVTAGIVSARGREIGAGPYDDFLQIDASINKGNSGGPTFNLKGDVVGMNTAIYSPSGGSVSIGFAIPAQTVEMIVADLKEDGKVTRGWLGVQIQPVSKEIADSLGRGDNTKGALVAMVQDDSPAKKAGIKSGDAIISLDGKTVDSPRDLSRKVAGVQPGKTADLGVWRDGKEVTIPVTIGALPATQQEAKAETKAGGANQLTQFGLSVAPAKDVGVDSDGVAVVEVDPEGPAAEKGVQVGDVILEVGGKAVANAADVTAGVEAAKADGRKAVLLRLKSGDNVRFLALPVGKA